MNASVVGLGAWAIGGGVWWGQEPGDHESIRAIHAALESGVNLIDTAPAYGFVRSEEIVGRRRRQPGEPRLVAWIPDQSPDISASGEAISRTRR